MPRIAVIEDDPTTSEQLAGWIRAARPELTVAWGDGHLGELPPLYVNADGPPRRRCWARA